MCDTIGKIISKNYAIFGKNSDRAVNEPQVVEFYPSKDYKQQENLKCTYITINQVSHTNAIVLSRPTWLWGGEIGVNEYGVCIGNEAVFTKGKYGKEALIGMDLLRLGLERGNSAKQAMQVIIDLLQEYGQGGNCGYDSNFHYNNSFLIMDKKEIYVLETVDKDYVYKKYNHASISNHLTIGKDGDCYKNNPCDFNKKYSDFIMSFGSQGIKRQDCSFSHKLDNLEDMIEILSSHKEGVDVFKTGHVGSVCMHAANSLTADQTTQSMIVELKENDMTIWITGCSLPCVSLFKPFKFEQDGLIYNHEENNDSYWKEHEVFNRKLVNHKLPESFYQEKEKLQKKIISNGVELNNESLKFEKQFYDYWNQQSLPSNKGNFLFASFWNKKNNELK